MFLKLRFVSESPTLHPTRHFTNNKSAETYRKKETGSSRYRGQIVLDAKWMNFLTIFIYYSVNIKVSYKQTNSVHRKLFQNIQYLWSAILESLVFGKGYLLSPG